jgi:hypothetical protein
VKRFCLAAAAALLACGPAMAQPTKAPAGGGLKLGEYACYGSGGRIMIGLSFKLLAGGRYTDLDGGNPGQVAVQGSEVVFKGGHMDGQRGRELKGNTFRIGAQASCEPY